MVFDFKVDFWRENSKTFCLLLSQFWIKYVFTSASLHAKLLLFFWHKTGALRLLLGRRCRRGFGAQAKTILVKVTCRWLAKITAFSKLFGINRWRKIEPPGIISPVIFPINEAFRGLPDSSARVRQHHVQDLLHLRVVGRDVKTHARCILRAADVDRH